MIGSGPIGPSAGDGGPWGTPSSPGIVGSVPTTDIAPASAADLHVRAVADLVVQRLFGIAARLSGVRTDDALVASCLELIDDTIDLVRTEVLEGFGRTEDLSGVQADLLVQRALEAVGPASVTTTRGLAGAGDVNPPAGPSS